MTSSYGLAVAVPRSLVRHTNRPTSLPGCHRFILRDGPSSSTRRAAPHSVPSSRFASIQSLRDASHGLLVYTDTYRCFIGIHYLSTATISPAEERGSGYRYRFRPGPRGQSGKKGKESHKASQSRSPLRRSNDQIPGRFRPGFLASSMIPLLLSLSYFISHPPVARIG